MAASDDSNVAPIWPVCEGCGERHPNSHHTYLAAIGEISTTDEVRAFELEVRDVCVILVAFEYARRFGGNDLAGAIDEAELKMQAGLETDPI